MNIQLSDHFTYGKLARFTIPSIYGVVDGIFVSNYVGRTAFAAVNLIMPFLMIFGALGFMIGTGGSALISKTMGEGRKEKANELFSLLIAVSALISFLRTFLFQVGAILVLPALLGLDGVWLAVVAAEAAALAVTLVCFVKNQRKYRY